jgi:hypothetical protein
MSDSSNTESSSTESSTSGSARTDEGAPSGKDTLNSPESERETEELQEHSDITSTSTTANDPEVDSDAVKVLPGTGGPDDFGDIDIDPETLK